MYDYPFYGIRSISDDDLCADCKHCEYDPGHMSGCKRHWPGINNPDGYIISCKEYEEQTPNHLKPQ